MPWFPFKPFRSHTIIYRHIDSLEMRKTKIISQKRDFKFSSCQQHQIPLFFFVYLSSYSISTWQTVSGVFAISYLVLFSTPPPIAVAYIFFGLFGPQFFPIYLLINFFSSPNTCIHICSSKSHTDGRKMARKIEKWTTKKSFSKQQLSIRDYKHIYLRFGARATHINIQQSYKR